MMDEQNSKSSRRRWLYISLAVIIVILLVVGIGGRMWIGNQLSPEALVERIEAELNVRAQIEDTQISLFGSPARVRLVGFKMGPRDANANAGIPLGERAEMSRVNIECEEVVLAIPLGGLLRNEIDVRRLRFGRVQVVDEVKKSGKSRIGDMFTMPDIVGGKDNPKKFPSVVGESVESVVEVESGRRLFDLGSASVFASDGYFGIKDASIEIVFERQDAFLNTSGLNLEFNEIAFDPKNPAAANRAVVVLAGNVGVLRPGKGVDHGVLHLRGAGETTLVEEESGRFNPAAQLTLGFREDSEINLLPSLEKIQKRLEQLKTFGIDLADEVGDSIVFEAGSEVEVRYFEGLVTFETPLRARCGEFELEIEAGGVIEVEESAHNVRIHLLADAALSDRVRSEIREKAALIPSPERREKFMEELEAGLFIDGRFRPIFISSGDLDDPDVELANEVPDVEDFARGLLEDFGIDREQQDALKDSLRDLLRNR